jgi:CelD/BcsL family acetyltransferase involved in cellulose biosynthesis
MGETTSSRVVRNLDELRELAGAWDDLLARSLSDNVFLTWEWISNWARVYVSGGQLFVIAVYDQSQLVAVAPFWIQRVRTGGIFRTRTLRFIGVGEVCSDYLDVIVQETGHSRWLEEVWRRLFEHGSEWDILEYSDAPSDSRGLAEFWRFADEDSRCLGRIMSDTTVCPYMPLPEEPEHLLRRLSRTKRYTINHSRKRLSERAEIQVRFCEDVEQVSQDLTRLKELNTRSWRERGQSGSFATDEFVSFHFGLAERLLKLGHLLLCSLWVGDEYQGGFYGFVYHGVLYFYIMSVEKSDMKRVNVGDLVLSLCMEEGIRRGCREFDFLRGAEAYKYRWTETDRRLLSVRIYNRRPAALLSLLIQNASSSVRAIGKLLLRR